MQLAINIIFTFLREWPMHPLIRNTDHLSKIIDLICGEWGTGDGNGHG
jgi:hypothetical protein